MFVVLYCTLPFSFPFLFLFINDVRLITAIRGSLLMRGINKFINSKWVNRHLNPRPCWLNRHAIPAKFQHQHPLDQWFFREDLQETNRFPSRYHLVIKHGNGKTRIETHYEWRHLVDGLRAVRHESDLA